MITLHCKTDPSWLGQALAALRRDGCCAVDGVLDGPLLDRTRASMYRAQAAIHREVGRERLAAAGELGVLRLMMRFEPALLELLVLPEVLAVVDATVSPTAILHLQNGFILPSSTPGAAPRVFQNTWHRDFPRHLEGYVASVNVLFAVDEFREDNGCTWVVPGTHQKGQSPSREQCDLHAVPAVCDAGAMILFDSTLWHAAGHNTSGRDRLAINHQFTRSWIKQQIDYVRALGSIDWDALTARTQQLLGYYTRVVTSLDEYYRPQAERLYRRGQG